MYDVRPNFIIGFHGCEESIRDKLIANPNDLVYSKKPYDWLGNGMYFWENNYTRALLWAEEKTRKGEIKKPSVLGSVIHLGYCCDFLDSKYIRLIQQYYNSLKQLSEKWGDELPKNKNVPSDLNGDMLLRELDCAVIEHMHERIFETWKKDIEKKGIVQFKILIQRGVFLLKVAQHSKGQDFLKKAIFKYVFVIQIVLKGFSSQGRKLNFLR